MRYLRGRGHVHIRDDLYPISSKLQYMVPGIVWLYYACSYTVALSPGMIPSFAVKSLLFSVLSFFCLVCRSLEKN